MFKVRFFSGMILTLIVIGALYLGGVFTGAFMLLLSLGGVFELLRIYKLHSTPIGTLSYAATLVYYALLYFDLADYTVPLIIVFLLAVLSIYVICYPKYRDVDAAVVLLSFCMSA